MPKQPAHCVWAYRTTAGLTVGCELEPDHEDDHLDQAGRRWKIEGGRAVLTRDEADHA